MIGSRTAPLCLPRPLFGPDSIDEVPHVTASQAIEDLQDTNEVPNVYTGKYGQLLGEVPPGQNYHFFTKEMGYPAPIFAWRSRFSDFLYKADPTKPVRTIVASLGAYSGPFHWKNRKFTIDEFKRLQTFPDDYQIVGGANIVQRQIGNSVPPLFAECLAKAVRQQLFGVDLRIAVVVSRRLSHLRCQKESQGERDTSTTGKASAQEHEIVVRRN